MPRRLTRNTRNSVLGGVAAGFGDYLDLDPILVRLLFVVLALAGGSGLLIYAVAWVVMPAGAADGATSGAGEAWPGSGPGSQAPGAAAGAGNEPRTAADRLADEVRGAGEKVVDQIREATDGAGRGRLVAGVILILLGGVLLMDQFLPMAWLSLRRLWPLLLIIMGVVILVRSRQGSHS